MKKYAPKITNKLANSTPTNIRIRLEERLFLDLTSCSATSLPTPGFLVQTVERKDPRMGVFAADVDCHIQLIGN